MEKPYGADKQEEKAKIAVEAGLVINHIDGDQKKKMSRTFAEIEEEIEEENEDLENPKLCRRTQEISIGGKICNEESSYKKTERKT